MPLRGQPKAVRKFPLSLDGLFLKKERSAPGLPEGLLKTLMKFHSAIYHAGISQAEVPANIMHYLTARVLATKILPMSLSLPSTCTARKNKRRRHWVWGPASPQARTPAARSGRSCAP